MPAHLIRADYDSLAQIAKQFERQAADADRTHRRVRHQMETLQNGDWLGKGAQAFYREMDDEILPSLQRLSAAMRSADQVTRKIGQIMKQAEEDAAGLFRLEDLVAAAQWLGVKGEAVIGGEGSGGGTNVGKGLGMLDAVREGYKDSAFLRLTSGAFSTFDTAGKFAKHLDDVPPSVSKFLNNKYLSRAGKTLGTFGMGLNIINFARDPGVQTGADLGAGLAGLSSNPYLMAFSGGYAFGSAFIAPYTTGPLSDGLASWDPLDLGYSPGNYPRTTIKDYQRSGKTMPFEVAGDVYRGLRRSSASDAKEFLQEYTKSEDMTPTEFMLKSGNVFM